MSGFSSSITGADRAALTVVPPPVYKRDGTLCEPMRVNDDHLNAARIKQHNVVFVDEELDAYDHPGSLRHYRMMVRCMPFRADLNVIMRAAQHMLLIGDYSIAYEQAQALHPDLESGYWDIEYTIAREEFSRDEEILAISDVYVPYAERRRIWIELFSSLGHKVKWGNTVLNVRKRR